MKRHFYYLVALTNEYLLAIMSTGNDVPFTVTIARLKVFTTLAAQLCYQLEYFKIKNRAVKHMSIIEGIYQIRKIIFSCQGKKLQSLNFSRIYHDIRLSVIYEIIFFVVYVYVLFKWIKRAIPSFYGK